jgi:ABC-type multidrug transport system ATPase subunit
LGHDSIDGMIEVQNLSKNYSGKPVLKNVSFSILPGEVVD